MRKTQGYCRAHGTCERSRLLQGVMPVGWCHVGSKEFQDGSRSGWAEEMMEGRMDGNPQAALVCCVGSVKRLSLKQATGYTWNLKAGPGEHVGGDILGAGAHVPPKRNRCHQLHLTVRSDATNGPHVEIGPHISRISDFRKGWKLEFFKKGIHNINIWAWTLTWKLESTPGKTKEQQCELTEVHMPAVDDIRPRRCLTETA